MQMLAIANLPAKDRTDECLGHNAATAKTSLDENGNVVTATRLLANATMDRTETRWYSNSLMVPLYQWRTTDNAWL